MPTVVTVVWRDESREPLKTEVDLWSLEGGWLRLELPHDLIPSGAEAKELVFPSDLVSAIEILDTPDIPRQGYREDSTFRETPDKSRWFRGMGNGRDEEEG